MKRVVVLLAFLLLWASSAVSAEDVSSLLSRFQAERDVTAKEAVITEIVRDHPDAGPQLLQVATVTTDVDTRWLAIRGLGDLKFQPATQFLLACLTSPHSYVRANAARALGDIKAYSAEPILVSLLRTEQDNGVIEQTAAALEMIKATKAVPVLRERAESAQNPQTECWLIGAIAALGSRQDVPFVAKRLYDSHTGTALCAASALQQLTREDLRLGLHPGPNDPSEAISQAKNWWERNAASWK